MSDQNSIRYDAEDSTQTVTPDAPAAHTPSPEAGIADRVREKAAELGVNPEFIEFPPIVEPQTDDEGRLYVEDMNNVVRYFLEEGRVEPTSDHTERHIVAGNNQRKLEMRDMTDLQ